MEFTKRIKIMYTDIILKIHFASTFYLLGMIYIIQVIHYPVLALIGKDEFVECHAKHVNQTTFVIAIPMIIEFITMLLLLLSSPVFRNDPAFIFASVMIILIWCVTFFISVPLHNILATGYDQKAWKTLLKTNWIRTGAWSIRAALLFYLL